MSPKRASFAVLALVGAVSSPGAWPAGPDGALLAGTCVGCHGPAGSSMGPASPTIAGMLVDTFVEEMKSFKAGARSPTIMDRIAKGYTDDEIKAMAEYFSQQPFVRHPQPVNAAQVKAGQALAEEHCKSCHTNDGRKDEEGSGILAGQWLPYLQYAIDDFHAGTRDMPKQMKKRIETIIGKSGPDGLQSVLQFYASQK